MFPSHPYGVYPCQLPCARKLPLPGFFRETFSVSPFWFLALLVLSVKSDRLAFVSHFFPLLPFPASLDLHPQLEPFFCEPSFSSATGPSAEDLVLAGNCPQFSAFWFPIRIPSLRHSDTHFCWNCIIFLLSPIFLPDSFPQHSHSNLGYRSLPVASLSTATLTWAVLSSHPRPLQKLPLAIVLGALWS